MPENVTSPFDLMPATWNDTTPRARTTDSSETVVQGSREHLMIRLRQFLLTRASAKSADQPDTKRTKSSAV